MARVSVEQKALTDPRFFRLGSDLGAPDAYAHAVGLVAMIRVWNECIERGSYSVDGWLIQAALGRQDAVELVCAADLAVRAKGEKYRVKGTHGRVEYLEKLRESGKVNGPKGAQFGKLGGRPRKPSNRVTENGAGGIAGNPPLTLTPALTLTLTQETGRDPEQQPLLSLEPATDPGSPVAVARGIWRTFNATRRAAIPGAREIPPTDGVLSRVVDLLEQYPAADVEAVIAHLGERCRLDPSQRKWFDAVTPFRPDNFARALSQIGTQTETAPERPYNGRG